MADLQANVEIHHQAVETFLAAAVPEHLLDRLTAATSSFESDAAGLGTPTIDHPVFSRGPLTDFVRLQEIQTRHHRGRLAPAAG